MAVTIKDIADKVGRSLTTVSRALSGYDDVSPETRRRVLQAAEELGYEANITAQQLQKRRTDTLGLILPFNNPQFSDPFFSEFLPESSKKPPFTTTICSYLLIFLPRRK